jgi:CheY-like chemotaxis protein
MVQPPPASAPTILFVDDQPEIRTLGRRILYGGGFNVLDAADGVAAVDLYRRESASIALVVLDLTMPTLSGVDTLAQLLQINPDLKAIISSGYESRGEDLPPMHFPAVFLNKPYRPAELMAAVRQALAAT